MFFGVAEAVSRWLCNFGVGIVKSVSTKFFVLPICVDRTLGNAIEPPFAYFMFFDDKSID